jgi:putative FmdB family regulatory protein
MEEPVPTYDYACTECDHRFDIVQAFTDDSLTVCPVCGGKLRKVFGAVGVVFKGSGFYRNDSRSSSNGSSSSTPSSNGSGSNGSESTSSEKSGGDKSSSTTSGSGAEKAGGSKDSKDSKSAKGSDGAKSTSKAGSAA